VVGKVLQGKGASGNGGAAVGIPAEADVGVRVERWQRVKLVFRAMEIVVETSNETMSEAEVCPSSRKSSRIPTRQAVWVAA